MVVVKMSKFFTVFFITIFFLFLSIPFFLNSSRASSLGPSYLFFERMQIDTASGMVLLFTPSSDFVDSEENRVLKISFPGDLGGWCLSNSAIGVSGVSSSAIDVEGWSIDEVLPGTLSGSCVQSSDGDYIQIEGIGNLSAGVSYGLEIANEPTVFNTIDTAGEYLITVQLIEGLETESISFEITLLETDEVLVSALVSDTVSINCTLESGAVDFGTLYKTGSYITSSLDITTESTSGFYWAVYGHGGLETAHAGLYNSEGSGYLLSSAGVDGRVNLLTGEGFGMVVSSSEGVVPSDFSPDTPGVFGAIGKGTEEAKLFLNGETINQDVYSQVTYGVRAGSIALSGNYNEALTYVCGGYIGE
jgi:hypothetical protein